MLQSELYGNDLQNRMVDMQCMWCRDFAAQIAQVQMELQAAQTAADAASQELQAARKDEREARRVS